jgi:hypothetical protein
MQPRSPAAAEASAAGATMVPSVGGVEPAVTLDQVPRWSDPDQRIFLASTPDEASAEGAGSDATSASGFISFSDPLTVDDGAGAGGRAGAASRFPVDQEINSRIYLWRGQPWNLEVDAVVNSTNEVSIPVPRSSHQCWELVSIFWGAIMSSCLCSGVSCRAWTRRTVVPGCTLLLGQGSPRSAPPWYCSRQSSCGKLKGQVCSTVFWSTILQGGCRTGMAKMTNGYDLPAR